MLNNNLPATSRVWVYQSDREFTPAEVGEINQIAAAFAQQWSSHKVAVPAQAGLVHNRFLILMADDTEVGIGGCSIDSSVRFVKELEAKYNAGFFDRTNTAIKLNNNIKVVTPTQLQQLIDSGEVTSETIVFNNLVNTKQQLQEQWEVPLAKSWHARMYNLSTQNQAV